MQLICKEINFERIFSSALQHNVRAAAAMSKEILSDEINSCQLKAHTLWLAFGISFRECGRVCVCMNRNEFRNG